ncbi:MAG: outer membrane lipoprotein carrier protein LolA [Desulfovibrionaceae bacterium]|nr:outer membrane lipoprotein carrier protein LolA [Desulfovibrionaceae bacterium]MBF0513263.1 outer membrane lipoprotein carrier protein LolA [Desulfovibrionaceae bacterium]
MKLFKLYLIVFALLAATAAIAWAGPEIAGKIQKQYQSIGSFTAAFNQELVNAASKDHELRAGTIAFSQPGLIRWQTVTPEKELLIVGREVVWDYFEDEKTAYEYPLEEILNSKTMLKFLSGKANLTEDFLVSEEKDQAAKDQGLVALRLIPKEAEPGLVLAQAWVDAKTFLLRRIVLRDFYGNTNDLRLSDIKINAQLPKNDFDFTPPKGVEIMDQTKPKERALPR